MCSAMNVQGARPIERGVERAGTVARGVERAGSVVRGGHMSKSHSYINQSRKNVLLEIIKAERDYVKHLCDVIEVSCYVIIEICC